MRNDQDQAWDANGTLLSTIQVAYDDTAEVNQATLQSKAQNALTTNANFLAITAPTNAQTIAQVQALTKECNGLIRLLLRLFDSVANT